MVDHLSSDRERDLGAANRAPSVKAISRNKTPTFLECFAVGRRGVDSFSSGIDCLIGNLRILLPSKGSVPSVTHCVQMLLVLAA